MLNKIVRSNHPYKKYKLLSNLSPDLLMMNQLVVTSSNFGKIQKLFGGSKKNNSGFDEYHILGLNSYRHTLTLDVLQQKFKELSLKYHPDLNQGQNTNEKYMEIKDSYEKLRAVLNNEEKNKNFSNNDTFR
jgi:DnaJ-class molecular chaperone